jgi:tRNA1(Val) A37 N6-methylase TrmN6
LIVTVSSDRLLGGRVLIQQPRQGYRVAIDPVLLAASVPILAGQRALDLGCGVGAAGLCLLARVPGAIVMGIEIDPDMASLADASGLANGYDAGQFTVICADVATQAKAATDVDHVLMNPPFHDVGSTRSHRAQRDRATHGGDDLPIWLDVAYHRLKHRGSLSLIWPSARLSFAIGAVSKRFGSLKILPIWPRDGAPAKRVILQAVKGGRAPEALLAGLVLHGTANGYTGAADAILRDAAALDWKDRA